MSFPQSLWHTQVSSPPGFHPKISDDVLGAIFHTHCQSISKSTLSIREGPLLLSRVCVRWRKLILSLPTCWNVVHHRGDLPSPDPSLIQLFLERSQPLPFSFDLDSNPRASVDYRIDNLLIDHAHRWKRITLHLDYRAAIRLAQLRPTDFKSLSRLVIRIRWAPNEGGVDNLRFPIKASASEAFANLFSAIPTLVDFQWRNNGGEHLCIASPNVRWPYLKHIDFDVPNQTAVELLSRCPNLVTASLSSDIRMFDINSPPPQNPPPNMLLLPALSFLDICWIDEKSLLDCLILPVLYRIKLTSHFLRGSESLERLVQRSGCTITSLSIIHPPLDGLNTKLLSHLRLPCLRSVRELSLIVMFLDNSVIDFLTWDPDGSPSRDAFPNLTNLELAYCKTDDGVVGRMISSRWAADDPCRSRLTSAVVIFSYRKDAENGSFGTSESARLSYDQDLALLRKLSTEGLDITLKEVN